MRFVRATWSLRLFAAAALLSLLPSLVAPVARVGQYAESDYGDWLRTQLRESPSEGFEAAIERAMATSPRTLHAFLSAFIQAYGDADGLSHAFTGAVIQAEDLLDLLSQRFSRLVGDAVAPELLMKATPVRVALSERTLRAVLTRASSLTLVAFNEALRTSTEAALTVLPRRLLTALQPLGP
ncbi:MAG: hypothetical protein R2834_07145 [Rhodothermales bacterium]